MPRRHKTFGAFSCLFSIFRMYENKIAGKSIEHLELTLLTGMRNGEIKALQWQDIDFDKRIIHVNSTLKYIPKGEPKYMFDTPKSQSSIREIPMLDNVYTILKEHRKQQLQNKQLLEERWSPQKGFENLVFTGCFGLSLIHI